MKKELRIKNNGADSRGMREGGFTLLELIVVLAVLSILTVAVVLVLDPLEMIARASDATRLSDMDSLDDAIQLAIAAGPQKELGGTDLDGSKANTCVGESAQTLYVSVPNSETPPIPSNLPAGWGYGQVAEADLGRVDGNGWIPVDFTNGGSITPALSNLPLDPDNTFANGYFYTYVCTRNPHFELTARMASDKHWTGGSEDKASTDGGDDPFLYEAGTDINLNPLGPVGYWPLDGGTSGVIANNNTSGLEDLSGNGNDGTAVNADGNGMSWIQGILNGAVSIDGVDESIEFGSSPMIFPENDITISMWVNANQLPSTTVDVSQHIDGSSKVFIRTNTSNQLGFYVNTSGGTVASVASSSLVAGEWYNFVGVYDGNNVMAYLNGVSTGVPNAQTGLINYPPPASTFRIAGATGGTGGRLDGDWDEIMVYDRALSATDISNMYNTLRP